MNVVVRGHGLAVALALLGPLTVSGNEPALRKTTLVYKTVARTPLHADVYRTDDQKVRPVVVWLHGGARATRKVVVADTLR